ncbi:hypothetical protein OROGR_017387 [Orobanche gracilis]
MMGMNAEGFLEFPPIPSDLLDLPAPSGRDVGVFFSACLSGEQTSGGFNFATQQFGTLFTKGLMVMAKPASSDYIVRDTGNWSPRYMKCTVNQNVARFFFCGEDKAKDINILTLSNGREGMKHLLGECEGAYIFRLVFPTEKEAGHILEKVPKFKPTYIREKDTPLKDTLCTKIKNAHVYIDFATKLIPLLMSMYKIL